MQRNFLEIFLDQNTSSGQEKHLGGALRGAQPTRARLGARARPGGLCPPQLPPELPIYSINTQYSRNSRGVDENQFQPPPVPEPPDPI